MKISPTLSDVAAAVGMHKSTVSLALSGKGNLSAATRARVCAMARALGYAPNPVARRLATGGGSDQVCLFTGVLDLGLSTEKLLLIQQALSARGLEVPVHIGSEPRPGEAPVQASEVRQLCRQRPRAVVCASHRVEAAVFDELARYQEEGGVLVCYDNPVPLPCDQVLFDREESAYLAARYLLERGHRRLGFGISIAPPGMEPRHHPIDARLRGFTRALREFGAPMRPEWLFRTAVYERGGAELAGAFLRLPERPTGLCLVNDYLALAFMVEILRAGLEVPRDVSIVGHDNQPVAEYCPVPLTSLTHPAAEIASQVVTLLCDRLEGRLAPEAPPRAVRVTGELVERASVGPPPAG